MDTSSSPNRPKQDRTFAKLKSLAHRSSLSTHSASLKQAEAALARVQEAHETREKARTYLQEQGKAIPPALGKGSLMVTMQAIRDKVQKLRHEYVDHEKHAELTELSRNMESQLSQLESVTSP